MPFTTRFLQTQSYSPLTGISKGGRRICGSLKVGEVSKHRELANVYFHIGYIPQDVWERSGTNSKQVSRTLEVNTVTISLPLNDELNIPQYAFDDFTISQVAKALGHTSDGKKA